MKQILTALLIAFLVFGCRGNAQDVDSLLRNNRWYYTTDSRSSKERVFRPVAYQRVLIDYIAKTETIEDCYDIVPVRICEIYTSKVNKGYTTMVYFGTYGSSPLYIHKSDAKYLEPGMEVARDGCKIYLNSRVIETSWHPIVESNTDNTLTSSHRFDPSCHYTNNHNHKSPKPSPLPDTTKPIKDKIKMQPRWRDSTSIILTDLGNKPAKDIGAVDTVIVYGTDSPEVISAWMDASKATRGETFTITPIQDTSRCLLLVSDTSNQNGFRSSRCWWMEGWVVKELRNSYYNGKGISVDPNLPFAVNSDILKYNYWHPTEFLDETRHPLKKNFIVWLSKEIK